ncbi:MAG: hypothetical protein AABW50_01020 [Nanoarchaeota archaeon]
MKLKKFFKPTSLKVRIAIAIVLIYILLLFLPYVFDNSGCIAGCRIDPEGKIRYPCGCSRGLSATPLLFTLTLSYLLSCLMVFFYEKIKK